MRNGECDAALIDVTGYEEDVTKQACDMMFVGSVALSIYTGFAASPEYAETLSYWMRQLSWSAESSYLEQRHRRPALPTMECNPHPNLGAAADGASRLGMNKMLAPMVLLAVFIAVGLIVHHELHVFAKRKKRNDVSATENVIENPLESGEDSDD